MRPIRATKSAAILTGSGATRHQGPRRGGHFRKGMPMTVAPIQIKPRAVIEFDEEVLQSIVDIHGVEAELHIASLLADLERVLAAVAEQARVGTIGGLRRGCEDLLPYARAVGMTSVERAAQGVLDCIRTGDGPALAACTMRLLAMARPDAFHDWHVAGGTMA
jgi:hypothetical protein